MQSEHVKQVTEAVDEKIRRATAELRQREHEKEMALREFGYQANTGRAFVQAAPQNRVSEAHKSLLDRAADIPGVVQQYCKPASAKPVLHPPTKWKITDATTKCPLTFLREVYAYALQTGQDAMNTVLASAADPDLARACRDLMQHVQEADF